MNKDRRAQVLFVLISISGIVLALATLITSMNFLVPVLVPVFVMSALLLPWARKANIWINRAGILGVIFYLLVSVSRYRKLTIPVCKYFRVSLSREQRYDVK